jgi:hypothetical protein
VGNFNTRSRTHTQIQIEYLQYQSNAQALISTSGEQESKSRRGSAYRKKKKLVTFEKFKANHDALKSGGKSEEGKG